MSESLCPSSVLHECPPADCRWRCAVDVIDELLRHRGAATGEETDLLLDLRWHLRHRVEPEAALRLFCDLRRRMERRHYLAFFRIRRWLENHMVASVRICPAAKPTAVPVKLDLFCIEAVRRVCLCAALGQGSVMLAPRLEFAFRAVQPVAETRAEQSLAAI